jgi:hypothetical protein
MSGVMAYGRYPNDPTLDSTVIEFDRPKLIRKNILVEQG